MAESSRTPARLPPLKNGTTHARSHLAAAQYFEEHDIRAHFTTLTQMLLVHQPKNALRFMVSPRLHVYTFTRFQKTPSVSGRVRNLQILHTRDYHLGLASVLASVVYEILVICFYYTAQRDW